jgi:hypothetical protein
MTYSDGDVYDGHWLNGKENGKGRMTYSDGDVYDGDWLNGKWHGPGSWNMADGETQEGEFKDGKLWTGMYTLPSGDMYKYEEGQREEIVEIS